MKPRPLFSNIGHHMKILAMIANLFNGWCHLHQLQIWPPSGTTCIGSTFSHQVAPLALFPKLATRSRHLHCYIGLDCLLALSVSIELVSSSARVTSVKFQKGLRLSQFFTVWVPIYISGSLFSVFCLCVRKKCQFSMHVYNFDKTCVIYR